MPVPLRIAVAMAAIFLAAHIVRGQQDANVHYGSIADKGATKSTILHHPIRGLSYRMEHIANTSAPEASNDERASSLNPTPQPTRPPPTTGRNSPRARRPVPSGRASGAATANPAARPRPSAHARAFLARSRAKTRRPSVLCSAPSRPSRLRVKQAASALARPRRKGTAVDVYVKTRHRLRERETLP